MGPHDDLTIEEAADLFDLEEPAGVLRWRKGSNPKRTHHGKKVGTLRNGYLTVIINGRQYSVHRIVWFMRHGRWPDGDVDHHHEKHENGDGQIREATRAQNIQASRMPVRSATGFRGVGRSLSKFVARNYRTHIGTFETAEDAAKAYDAHVLRKYGPLARTNFPVSP